MYPPKSKEGQKEEMHRPQLPESLESIQKAEYFPLQRHRWNTNEEIASILISFDKHEEWLSKEVKIRPKSGSMMLYSRKRVRYRRDGYCWKKRKDGKTTREDHMKLKVQGTECIYGCYVHSAILPTFHRRCYWLLQNPDIVLVHYLNVPYTDDNKIISPTLNYFADSKKEWTKEELIAELKPMFFSENEPDLNNELELSTAETIEAIVQQLMAKQRAKVKALEDANDMGINARALTVVAAVTNSTKEKNLTQQELHLKNSMQGPKSVVGAPKNSIAKRDVTTTCILAPPSGTVSRPVTTVNQGSVQLLQLGNTAGASSQIRSSNSVHGQVASGNGPQASLIFNLSQFQNGSGLLILNSAAPAAQTNSANNSTGETVNTPVTLVYGRSNSSINNNSNAIVNNISPSTNQLMKSTQNEIILKKLSEIKQEKLNTTSATLTSPNISSMIKANTVTAIDIVNGNCVEKKESSKTSDTTEDAVHNLDNRSQQPFSITNQIENTSVNHNPEETDMIISTSPSVNATGQSNNLSEASSQVRSGIIEQANTTNNLNQSCIYNYSISPIQFSHQQQSTHTTNQYSDMDPVDLNPMDFIENDISTPDEELFNLDAFDMLTDFPSLDDLNSLNTSPYKANKSNISIQTSLLRSNESYSNQASSEINYREGGAYISDFSPEWCYPDGGIKVLVAGPWFSNTVQYAILFDSVSVPTSLVQNGVLRCYSPAHEPGFVTLQVACQGCIISNSVIFEYKDYPVSSPQSAEDYFNVDDNVFKFCLLERLEILESHVSLSSKDMNHNETGLLKQVSSFEDRLLLMFEQMMYVSWLPCDDSKLTSQCLRTGASQTDKSLLHLAAALGFSSLIQCLLRWKAENPSLILEMEVDAFSVDKNECTSLMWACARGHKETAILLYRWNKASINLCNNQGFSPLHLGRKYLHLELVEEIETLQSEAAKAMSQCNGRNNFEFQANKLRGALSNGHFSTNYSTVKRGSACLNGMMSNRHRLFKCFSADGTCDPFHRNTSKEKNSNSIDVICNHTRVENELHTEKNTSSLRNNRFDINVEADIDSASDSDRVLTIAEHIIAAMPARIKFGVNYPIDCDDDFCDDDDDDEEEDDDYIHDKIDEDSTRCYSEPKLAGNLLGNSENRNLHADYLRSRKSFDFAFDLSENNNRYREAATTPTSSPASSCLHSPSSHNLESPSPPPTTADFCEFFQASGKLMQAEFSNLTLSDKEQRELYKAAKVIQKAYRSYKGRKREEQEKERQAAVLIQSYYRRYKQYIYYKQLTKAAQVIQNQFRNYCEHKRFKKCNKDFFLSSLAGNCSPSSSCEAHSVTYISNPYFRNHCDLDKKTMSSRDGIPTSGLKRTYSQRRQHQAARKIQQFLRQSKNKLQKERALAAEKETQETDTHQDLVATHRKIQQPLQHSDCNEIKYKTLVKKNNNT